MIEAASADMSSREVLAFRSVYDRIAVMLNGGDVPTRIVSERRTWDTLEAIGVRVDDALASGKSIGTSTSRNVRRSQARPAGG